MEKNGDSDRNRRLVDGTHQLFGGLEMNWGDFTLVECQNRETWAANCNVKGSNVLYVILSHISV